jgi:hypothetical protein
MAGAKFVVSETPQSFVTRLFRPMAQQESIGAMVGRGGYFERGGRSALTRRDTFFHESVTSHQMTKTPIIQIMPRTMAKANIFFILCDERRERTARRNEKPQPWAGASYWCF